MSKKLCITSAGLITRMELIPCRDEEPMQKPRAGKTAATRESVLYKNQQRSWQRLEDLIAVNFPTPGSGIVCTFTFDDRHKPPDRGKAQERFAYFRNGKLAKERAASGLPPPVVIWAPEILTSKNNRWHFHGILTATGHDYDMLHRLWIYGPCDEFQPLRVDDQKNHESLARYMSKEPREAQEWKSKPGLHGWSCSRNAKRPDYDVQLVPDDYELQAPEGVILLDHGSRGEGLESEYLKFRAPIF